MKKQFLLLVAMVTMVTFPANAWEKMYLIGDATIKNSDRKSDANPDGRDPSDGWILDNAVEMTKISETEFTWTGELGTGQLKFLTQKDWSNMYGPAHNNYSSVDTETNTSYNQLMYNATYDLELFGDGGEHTYGDYKFGVEKAGWYTVHVRTDLMKVTTWAREIRPVGSGCEVGWNTQSDIVFTETDFGAGKYQGHLTLNDEGELKFMCQGAFEGTYFGPTDVVNGKKISGVGTYNVSYKYAADGDDKFEMLSGAAGTYKMTLDALAGTLTVAAIDKKQTIKAQVELAALAEMGSVNCHVWVNGGEAQDYTNLVPTVDGWYSVTVLDASAPINFLFYGNDWKVQTPDMTNGGTGYDGDKCCTVYAEKQEDGGKLKLKCLHNDNCESVLTEGTVTLEFKAKDGTNLTSEDLYLREWQYFYAEGASDAADHTNYWQMTKDASGVYKAEFPAVNTVKFVLQTNQDPWAPVTNEVNTLRSGKYWIVATEEGSERPYVLTETENFNTTPTVTPAVSIMNDNVVYDVMGRALGTSVENLPQGLYIRNGKTFVVVK